MSEAQHRRVEDQLRDWADDLALQVPPWAVGATVPSAAVAGRRRWRIVAVAVAAAAALVIGVGVDANQAERREVGVSPSPAVPVEVEYERASYTQSALLQCAARAQETSPTYESAIYETWADRVELRWRTRVTYPDGSTRDSIALGSPWFPKKQFTKGRAAGAAVGCDDVTLLEEPGPGITTLNAMADLPQVLESELAPLTAAFLLSAREGAAFVGPKADSQGRSSELVRRTSTGVVDDSGRVFDEVVESYTAPSERRTLETVRRVEYPGAGTAEQRWTLLEHDTRRVDPSWFDTSGYRAGPGRSMPTAASTKPVVVVDGTTGSGRTWKVSTWRNPGQLCVEVTLGGSGNGGCEAKPAAVLVELAVAGDERLLFGAAIPGVTSVRIDLAGSPPLFVPTSDKGREISGFEFFGVVLPSGATPTRVAGIDGTGAEKFVSSPLRNCAPGAAPTTVCRIGS